MSEKTLRSRVRLKGDTEENWLRAINFIPLENEMIIYNQDDNYSYSRLKVGDGVTNVNDLPFVSNALLVTVTASSMTSSGVSDYSSQEIFEAIQNGRIVYIYHSVVDTYAPVSFATSTNVEFMSHIIDEESVYLITFRISGYDTSTTSFSLIPTKTSQLTNDSGFKTESDIATSTSNGLMSLDDKMKLDGIENNANNYVLPIANSSEIGGIKSGNDISVDSTGEITVNHSSEATKLSTPSLANTFQFYNKETEIDVYAGARHGWNLNNYYNARKRFSMLVGSDVHGSLNNIKSMVGYLNDIDCFDCGINLGDTTWTSYSDNIASYFTHISESNKTFLTVIGNHDAGSFSSTATAGTNAQVYDKFIGASLSVSGLTVDTNKRSYYYKDFTSYTGETSSHTSCTFNYGSPNYLSTSSGTSAPIRLIVLCGYEVPDSYVSSVFSTSNISRALPYYSKEQITWLQNLLYNTPSNYTVVIATHSAPAPCTPNYNIKFQTSTDIFDDVHTAQGTLIPDIIDAWINKKNYVGKTYSYDGFTALNVTTNSINFSLRTSNNVHFAGYVVGHMHHDSVGYITDYPYQNVIAVPSMAFDPHQNAWDSLMRIDETKAGSAITAISIGTEENDRYIYLVRIGANIDSELNRRDPVRIPYGTTFVQKGELILTDQTTGDRYQVFIDNGKLHMEVIE